MSSHQTRDLVCFADSSCTPWTPPTIIHLGLIATILQTYLDWLCVLLSQQSHFFRYVWCRRTMNPGKIFTGFAKFQEIVCVNDFRLPIWLQELLQALLCFLRSFCFARIRLDPLGGYVLHHDCISMIVSRFTIVAWDLVICCYQITKICGSRYGFAIASSARGSCNLGPLADLAISVFREVSVNTMFTQIRTSRRCRL